MQDSPILVVIQI